MAARPLRSVRPARARERARRFLGRRGMAICPRCGEENPDRFRLCGFCGTSLGPDLAKHEVRKTVTIVFCDLKGSTSLAERLDSETFREVLNHYFGRMEKVLEGHGGTVEKFI